MPFLPHRAVPTSWRPQPTGSRSNTLRAPPWNPRIVQLARFSMSRRVQNRLSCPLVRLNECARRKASVRFPKRFPQVLGYQSAHPGATVGPRTGDHLVDRTTAPDAAAAGFQGRRVFRKSRIWRPVQVRSPNALLLDGARGTGKTSLLLTMAHRWIAGSNCEFKRNASSDTRINARENSIENARSTFRETIPHRIHPSQDSRLSTLYQNRCRSSPESLMLGVQS